MILISQDYFKRKKGKKTFFKNISFFEEGINLKETWKQLKRLIERK